MFSLHPGFLLPPVTLSHLSSLHQPCSSQTSPYLSSWPAWAYCPARHSYFSWPPICPFFSFSSLSTSPLYSLPLLPPFSSASPLLGLHCLSRCLPKVALPNVAAPFVAITQSGRLPPCRELLALAPPMIFSYLRAPFLCAAYGSGANYVDGCCGPPATRLSLGILLTT